MFKSIRWKFITVYFLLVFIAMIIVGVFIIQQLEDYHLDVVSRNLTKLARDGLLKSFEKFDDLDASKEEIQRDVETWAKGYQEEIFVINMDFKIIASSNSSLVNKSAVDALDYQLLTDGYNGQIAEANKKTNVQNEETTVKSIVFPIKDENTQQVLGILYLRANLKAIYESLGESRGILIQATLWALLITVILGYFIARSVTEPITDVTVKVAKMAKGDFDQVVDVKSNDEIGQLAEMFNYLREKLKITLKEVFNEKSKLQTILDYMADGLIAVDNQGRIIHINPTAIKMLNLTTEEVETKLFDDIMKELNDQLTFRFIDDKNEEWVGNELIKIKDVVLQANYAPFKDERDKNSGIVMVLQDITERQKLDNMRREFVANVSHELKTPLTSIKSYTETLLAGALDDRELSEDFLKVVDSEADRMTRLVRDLLQLSSIEYKQIKWNKRSSDLLKIIENSILKISMTAKNKKQSLRFTTSEESFIACLDSDRIEQVVLNILSNAIKYTPDHGKIEVVLEKIDQNVSIKIIDNGIGIPKEDIPRLFERFYRVDKARSRELGGTGLGLSIARQIIEAHGGTINVNSSEGEGTEVVIILPIQEQPV